MQTRRTWTWIPLGLMALAASSIAFAQGTLTHDYELNGTYADSLGGPSLVNDGGTLNASNYTFGANQGFNLSNAINASDYSIETKFYFDNTSGYRKILDFKDRASDNGLYNLSTQLDFFPFAQSGTTDFTSGIFTDVAVTRDGMTGKFSGYVNGTLAFSFTDAGGDAMFSTPNQLIRFFEDDFHTGQNEASSGVVDRIRIFDGALTGAQVQALADDAAVTPEGDSLLLISGGLLPLCGIGLWRLRRSRKA